MFRTIRPRIPDVSAAQRWRRSWWRRDPRLIAAGAAVTLLCLGGLATEVYGSHPAARTIRVQPGDTLWQIAARAYGDDDVRDRIDQIVTANSLRGRPLEAGQTISLP